MWPVSTKEYWSLKSVEMATPLIIKRYELFFIWQLNIIYEIVFIDDFENWRNFIRFQFTRGIFITKWDTKRERILVYQKVRSILSIYSKYLFSRKTLITQKFIIAKKQQSGQRNLGKFFCYLKVSSPTIFGLIKFTFGYRNFSSNDDLNLVWHYIIRAIMLTIIEHFTAKGKEEI